MLLTFFLYIFAGLLSRCFFLCSQRKRIETSELAPSIRRINRVSSFVRKGSGLKLNASALTHLFGLFLPLFTKKETKKKYDSFL
ncbi:hypothetical protein B1J94_16885 [Leptospira kirschneri serovar Grippotyphosa]|nr:hypothetical protein B1J94_16885 [Leptospira kirschneri serovar Grippotyphosa]